MDSIADQVQSTLGPRRALQGLFAKFLIVMVPIFLVLAVPGISLIIDFEMRQERQNLVARIGIQAARVAILLGRHRALDNPPLAQDLLAMMTADRAFRCAEVRLLDTGPALAAIPARLGCSDPGGAERLRIPVGEPAVAELLVQFNDDEIGQAESEQRSLTLLLVGLGFLFSVLAASFGFRLIVGKPLRQLLYSIQTSIATGVRKPLRHRSSDELGVVMDEFNAMFERDTRREATLQESERRYRELFEESPVPILEEDWSLVRAFLDRLADQGVKDFSKFFRENRDQLGRAYEAANRFGITQAVVELYRAKSREELQAAMTRTTADHDELVGYGEMISAFHGGATKFEYEAEEIACDGTPITTLIKAVMPLKYRDNWSRVLVTIEDVTKRKRAEDQLRQAQKMEAVGQLTGGVAHDFNNLLAVIMGNTELLGDRLGSEDKSLEAILRATTRGSELTQRLLAFSRQQPLRPQAIDLGGLVTSMSEMLIRTLGETMDIETSAAPGIWDATVDPGQVENALLNLALNARDAMPDGGKLTITCENAHLDDAYVARNQEAVAGDYVVLAVCDNGTGMSAEIRAKVFEPFYTTKDVGKGSGLGLSMVYGFAKQSGGHVTIYSEEDRGTTVKLYLPRAKEVPRSEIVHRDIDVPRGRDEAILVIEDDPDMRDLAVQLLEGLGYRAIEVPDAAGARLHLAGEAQVDLVLSDVVLPGGASGPEFAEEVRTTHPNLKIIFMSGYPAEAAKRNGFLDSGNVLLNKPFQRLQLANALRQALD